MVSIQLGEAFVSIRASLKQLDRDLALARRKITRSMAETSKRLQTTGRALTTGLTLPALALGAGIIRTAFKFQKSMNRVAALTGATGKEFQDLEGLAKKLGETTEFSASQAADGMAFLAQAGFKAQQILSAMPGVLQLASAGQLDLAAAADIASNLLTQFGLSADKINRVNDVLAMTAASANVNVFQTAEAMKFVGTTMKQASRPIEEAAAAIGLLGNAGIQGGIAGTSLNRAIINMLGPSDQMKEAMRELGVSVTDANDRLLPLADIIKQLEDNILSGGITAREASLIFEAFGIRGGRAIGALVGRSKELREFTRQLENAGGTAARISKIQLRGLVGTIFEFKSALEGAALTVAGAGLGGFTDRFVKSLTELVRDLTKANPEFLRFGTVVVAALGIAGPALLGLAIILKGLAVILRVVLSRLFLIPAAILIAGSAINQLRQGVTDLKEIFNGVKDDLAAIAGKIGELFTTAFDSLFQDLPPDQANAFKEAMEKAKQAIEGLAPAGKRTVDTFSKIKKALKDALADATFELKILRGEFGGLDEDALRAARDAGVLKDAIISIGTGKDAILVVDASLQKLSDTMKKVKEIQERMKTTTSTGTKLVERLGFAFSSAFEKALQGASSVSDILRALLTDIRNLVIRLLIIEPLFEFIKKKLQEWGIIACESTEKTNKCVEESQGVFSSFWGWLKGVLSDMGSFISKLFDGIGKSVEGLFGRIGSGSGGGLFGGLGGIFGDIGSFFGFGGGPSLSFGSGFGPGASAIFDAPLFFQEGGSLLRGQPAVVGEAGPELFIPNTAGMVVPNDEMGGQSVTVFQDIKIAGIEGMIRQVVVEQMARARDQIIATVRDEARSGSQFRDAFS